MSIPPGCPAIAAASPLEATPAAFDALVRAGKVRALGASNYSAERLAEALAISDANGFARVSVVQPELNLVDRDGYEGALRDLVAAEGLGAVPYYGLANGYLSGRYRSEADLAASGRPDRVRPYMAGNGPRRWTMWRRGNRCVARGDRPGLGRCPAGGGGADRQRDQGCTGDGTARRCRSGAVGGATRAAGRGRALIARSRC